MSEPDDDRSRLEAISTRWTLLRKAHGEEPATSADVARRALALRYLPAIRRYIGAIVASEQDADDMAQDVMVRLLAGDFAGADPARGRFRNLLKVAVRNMIRNRWAQQKRRRPTDLDVSELAAPSDEADDACWTSQWRQGVLDLAWKALEQQEQDRPGNLAYSLLRLRVEHPNDSSDELAQRLSQKLGQPMRADAVRQKLHRARLKLVDLLIAEVAKGLNDATPERIQEELIDLGLMDFLRELLPSDWKQDATLA